MPAMEVLYVGTKDGLEADIIPREGLAFATVGTAGFKRSFTPVNLFRAGRALGGVGQALRLVRRFRPDVVIGTGGYVCGPILLAAAMLQVPTLIQEQNVIPGITNKILSHFVDKIAVGTKEAAEHFPAGKTVFTGNPIRREVLTAKKADGLVRFGFQSGRKTVLISGGSRGARTINRAAASILPLLAADDSLQVLHVTGKGEYDDVCRRVKAAGLNLASCKNIKVVPYLYDMPQAMAMADLAVFRAGATGLAELTARGIPALLIPYPYAAENHQEYNARAMEKAGAAKVILNKDLTSDLLLSTVSGLLENEAELLRMSAASRNLGRPQAASEIAGLALSLAGFMK